MGQQKPITKASFSFFSGIQNHKTYGSSTKTMAAASDAAETTHTKRVAQSLVKEMSDDEKKEFNDLPSIEIEDME